MICLYPYKDKNSGLMFPCGRCMPCRVGRVREWTVRLLHEFEVFHGKALFLTLTYDDEHLPLYCSLVKEDLQKFIKRVRKRLDGRLIKYFACGEYGTLRGRPHYHLIMFGVDFCDVSIISECWKYCAPFLWCKGKAFDEVNRQTCQYVAGYVQKKIYGSQSKSYYEHKKQLPPFQLQSQGLGSQYFYKHFDRLMALHGVPYKNSLAPLPRYYKKKLNVLKSFPADFYEDLQEKYRSEQYKRDSARFREGWKKGLRHEDLMEYVHHSEITEINFSKRFDIDSNFWRNKL